MILFGVGIGVAFPFMVMALGVPSDTALTPTFIVACAFAGIMAGVANFSLARWVVGTRLRIMAEAMTRIRTNLEISAESGEVGRCEAGDCLVVVDSEDAFGEAAIAFNAMVGSLTEAMQSQHNVREFSEILASQLDLTALAESALERLMKHTGAMAGALLTDTGGEVKVVSARGVRSPGVLATSDHVRTAMRTMERVVVQVPDDVVVEGVLVDFVPRQVIVDPVCFEGRAIGAIVLAATRDFEGLRLRDLYQFGNGLGLALKNALVHDDLQRIAAFDALTGLYNRRFGAERLREEFKRSARSGEPLGVVMLDIDHFKSVNDTYGHLAGDRVLKAVARAIRAQVRDGDVAVRFGGEEFLMVLPAASKGDAHRIAERVRRAVAETVVFEGEQRIQVTLSAGVTSCPEQDAGNEIDLIRRADETLYKAKVGGRNQVLTSQSSECRQVSGLAS